MSLARSLLRASQKNNVCSPVYLTKVYLSSSAESFLSGANANFLEAQYKDWASAKGSIDSSWDGFYNSVCGPALKIEEMQDECSPKKGPSSSAKSEEDIKAKIKLHMAVSNLIRSYQARGHLLTKTDPLNLTSPVKQLMRMLRGPSKDKKENQIVSRELATTLCEKHMDMVFELPERCTLGGSETSLTLREIMRRLENAYCQSIGAEYMHLYDVDAIQFIRERVETPGVLEKTSEDKKTILRRLTKAVFLEEFFTKKWPAEKRFSLEGAESQIVMMEEIVDTSTRLGVQSIVMAMQHRGRLNVLVNVCRKQLTAIFNLFKPIEPIETGSGDVRWNLGTYIHRFIRGTNKYIKMTVSCNPSHLEVVTAVAGGKTRAEQFWRGDLTGDRVMAMIIHGDAAICGQGAAYEAIGQSNLPAFTTHGTLHIVVNNQIGYTTDPRFSRSSPYCSDIAKCIDAPVLHVNGDDPEAVVHVARVAIEFRCKFKKDVVIDLVCYRRFGHSEDDEPMFTQPFMYKKIKTLKTIDVLYGEQLKAAGVVTQAEIEAWQKDYVDALNLHHNLSGKMTKASILDWVDTPWTGFFESVDPKKMHPTGICQASIDYISEHFCMPPEPWAFELHPGILKILETRRKLVSQGVADWAMGEALAFGSLLRDGVHIRITGEDVERGTMAHRHHVYHHQGVDGATYRVIDHLYPDQARYENHNSALSELGILCFETGYSYSSPRLLSIWEAQFGDFANNAQAVIDTFISGGESKWVCQSGIVVQLPHGLDGGGPEHSSGRIERYLQQCSDDESRIPDVDNKDTILNELRAANWIVCQPTSAANYFHMIRRQIAMPFRKPLIVFMPKIGLKHVYYRSKFSEFLHGTQFRRVIPEEGPASKKPENVKKLVFCSGNTALKFDTWRKEKKAEEKIALCRIEQFYPFPYDLVLKEYCKYEKAKKFWGQEEHRNQGPWIYCKIRMENLFDQKMNVIARPSSSACATGIKWMHQKELKDLKESFLSGI